MITAWSPSRLSQFESCPKKAQYLYVQKLKEPQGAAAVEGARVHELAAQYVQGRLTGLPDELALFRQEFEQLRQLDVPVTCEQQHAFTSAMVTTGWFDVDAWLRVVFDVLVEHKDDSLTIIDHKNGKIRDKDLEQCELYACAGFVLFPVAQRITTKLWYLTRGQEYEVSYTRAESEEIWPHWVERAQAMLDATAFPARPSPLCRWCFASTLNAEDVDARYSLQGLSDRALRLCDAG